MVRTASACTCGPYPTVLQAFDGSDEVVIVRGISVEKFKTTNFEGVRSTMMIVEKVFKGKLKVREEIIVGQGGGADCISGFSEKAVGDQFLLYLKRPENHPYWKWIVRDPNEWFVSICDRSRELTNVGDDLLYLEKIDNVRGKTRISGSINRWKDLGSDAEGVTIKIIGAQQTYETKTNKDGVFEIYDLPAGKYIIEPIAPSGWTIPPWLGFFSSSIVEEKVGPEPKLKLPKQVAIMLEPNKHAGIEIFFTRLSRPQTRTKVTYKER
jgi:hypothetical protein